MKISLLSLLVLAAVSLAPSRADEFKYPPGIQFWSLRDQFAKDVPGTLDKVKAWGITQVETAGLYKGPDGEMMTAAKFREMLDTRGLKCPSAHFQYDALVKDIDGVIRDAKALGAEYICCAWIPHDVPEFDEAKCRQAIADFNKAGEAISKAGLKFAYHAHGYEFAKFGDGTYFDLMMKELKPEYVNFEMDVFWMVHSGNDPVALLEKYPGRWVMMHIKDMKKGTPVRLYTGSTDKTNSVALGTGIIDYVPILKAAAKSKVKYYFIEDEAPTVEEQVPAGLKYLQGLKLN
jgi:sugar phosphate isomerase/epimerase